MGLAQAGVFADMYQNIREFIPEEKRKWVANQIYESARDMDIDDWDGDTLLEKDGHINQNLND